MPLFARSSRLHPICPKAYPPYYVRNAGLAAQITAQDDLALDLLNGSRANVQVRQQGPGILK